MAVHHLRFLVRPILILVLIVTIIDRYELRFFRVPLSTKAHCVVSPRPIAVFEEAEDVERYGSVISRWMGRQICVCFIPRGFDRKRALDRHSLTTANFAPHEYIAGRTINGKTDTGIEFGQCCFSSEKSLHPTLYFVHSQCHVSFHDGRSAVSSIDQDQRYVERNAEQIFRIVQQSQIANFESWTILSDIGPIEKARLYDGDNRKYEGQDGQSVVEPVSDEATVNIQLRNRRNDPYGLGFVFIAFCYVAGIWLGSFASDWRGISVAIGLLIIGTLTMMLNAFPWAWPCWAWLRLWISGA